MALLYTVSPIVVGKGGGGAASRYGCGDRQSRSRSQSEGQADANDFVVVVVVAVVGGAAVDVPAAVPTCCLRMLLCRLLPQAIGAEG